MLQRDMENWQNKFKNANTKIREMQNNLFASNNEKQRLTMSLRHKLNQ